jgi:hypothetical protein
VLSASIFYITTSFAETASYTRGSTISSSFTETASYAVASTLASVALISEQALTASLLEMSSSIVADINMPMPSWRAGQLLWDSASHTFGIHGEIPGTTLQIGQEMWLRVHAHENIPNGAPVYITPGELNMMVPHVELAIADGGGIKYNAIGISTHYIPSGSDGIITTFGKIHELDLSAFNVSDKLYLSNTQSGSYTNVLPHDPYEKVPVGYVINNTSGSSILLVDISAHEAPSYPFVGITTLPSLTNNGGGNFTVSEGNVNLCTNADGTGTIRNYRIPSASFTLNTSSLLDIQHIIAVYNSGSPVYQLVTNRANVDSIQSTFVYSLNPGAGGSISQIDYDLPGHLLANKLLTRIGYTRGIERAAGVTLSESASMGIAITEGTAWIGAKSISLPAVNSSGSRFILLAHSASVWSGSLITGSYNTIVDNGTNIVALSNNKYVVNYVYRGIGSLSSSVVILSPEYANLANAQASQPPTTPPEFLETAFMVGRMIYQQGVNTATQVDSAFAQLFVPSGITSHNDLYTLQGGSTGEYYHFSSASYANTLLAVNNGKRNIYTATANYNALVTDFTIIVSGSSAVTITLPAVSASHGKVITIKNRNTTPLYITTADNVLIDGDGPITSSFINTSIQLQCSGSEWFVL